MLNSKRHCFESCFCWLKEKNQCHNFIVILFRHLRCQAEVHKSMKTQSLLSNTTTLLDSPCEGATFVSVCVHVMRWADVCCIPDRFWGLWSTSLWYVSALPARSLPCPKERQSLTVGLVWKNKHSLLPVVLVSLKKKILLVEIIKGAWL